MPMYPACSPMYPACSSMYQVHSVRLRPSQLVLLPDGTSIGFHAPSVTTAGNVDASQKIAVVPATRIGMPWRELRSGRFRVEHGAAGLQYLTADDLVQAQLTTADKDSPVLPLSRWGCSAKIAGVWLCSGLLLVAGCFSLLLLALVALPRSCALRGLSEDEAWSRARSTMAFSLLNMLVIIDVLKIVVLVGTGPGVTSLVLRIQNQHVRFVVRNAVQAVHLPMALLCP